MDSPGLLQLTARPRRLVAAVVAAVAAALLASGSPTIADVAVPAPAPACHSTGWTVSPMTGAVLQESQTSIDGAPCVIKVTTHLPQASVEIVAQPAQILRREQQLQFGFHYLRLAVSTPCTSLTCASVRCSCSRPEISTVNDM